MKRFYMAIAHRGEYTVAMGTGTFYNTPKSIGDVRMFKTFEEADTAARFIAAGRSNYYPGVYVSNR